MLILQANKLSKLKKTYNKFMDGKNGRSLEGEITALFSDIRNLKQSSKNADNEIAAIKNNLLITYQKLGIIRYDAFREMGGKLSFAIAILDNLNDGFILNSVHSSDGCYTYIKEVKGGQTAIALGEEEHLALEKALYGYSDENMSQAKPMKKKSMKSSEIELDIEPLDLDELGFKEID